MYELEFSRVYDYSGEDESVLVPVVLRAGANEVRVAASVDTGASFCVFGAEIAEALGFDLTSGICKRFRTANSVFEAYAHEVELSVFGIVTHSLIYFFADPAIDRNVEDNGNIPGTYYLRANQAGGGDHVSNCGYVTSPQAPGPGCRPPDA